VDDILGARMSEENVERVRRIVQASQRGDWETALSGYAAAAVLDQTRMPDGGVYHGRAGVRDFYAHWFGAWEELQIEPEQIIDAGDDDVLVIVRIQGRGRESRANVAMRAADVMTLEGGEVIRQVGYPVASEALAALGRPG